MVQTGRKVVFTSLGGGNEIGASMYWWRFLRPVSRKETSCIVDVGAGFGENVIPNGFSRPKQVDYIFITHAHFDHVALLPRFVREQIERNPELMVFMTASTYELSDIQWTETISRDDRNKVPAHDRLFSARDICITKSRVRIVSEWSRVELAGDLFVSVIPAGHILGAVSFLFSFNGHAYLHTGDITSRNQLLVPGTQKILRVNKQPLEGIVFDSTYLGEHHPSENEEHERCLDMTRRVLSRGGVNLWPVFRFKAPETWEFLVRNGIPPEKIFIDGRESIFEIYKKYTPKMACPPRRMNFISGRSGRFNLFSSKESFVLLAHGGMVQEGSPAYWNMQWVLEDRKNGVSISSYMDPCSPVRGIFDSVQEKGNRVVILDDERFEVGCEVGKFGCFSTHDDENALKNLRSGVSGMQIGVHGDHARLYSYAKKQMTVDMVVGANGRDIRVS